MFSRAAIASLRGRLMQSPAKGFQGVTRRGFAAEGQLQQVTKNPPLMIGGAIGVVGVVWMMQRASRPAPLTEDRALALQTEWETFGRSAAILGEDDEDDEDEDDDEEE